MFRYRAGLVFFTTILLAGCGGSSGGDVDSAPVGGSEFQEVARFASAELTAIESAAPNPTAQKPYLGIQFVSIPEFPEMGTVFGEEMAAALRGDQTAEQALANAQEAADQIMRDAGYY